MQDWQWLIGVFVALTVWLVWRLNASKKGIVGEVRNVVYTSTIQHHDVTRFEIHTKDGKIRYGAVLGHQYDLYNGRLIEFWTTWEVGIKTYRPQRVEGSDGTIQIIDNGITYYSVRYRHVDIPQLEEESGES